MSEKIINMYVEAASDQHSQLIHKCLEALKEEQFDLVRDLDEKETLSGVRDLEHYFSGTDINWEVNECLFEVRFTTFPSLDEEVLGAFLYSVAEGCVEGRAYHEGMGEYSFFDHLTVYSDYAERGWKFLQRPLQLEGHVVVFTGSMNYGTREDVEELAEECDCEVHRSVTRTATLLVCGSKPGESKVKKAKARGVRVITEAEFLVAADEY